MLSNSRLHTTRMSLSRLSAVDIEPSTMFVRYLRRPMRKSQPWRNPNYRKEWLIRTKKVQKTVQSAGEVGVGVTQALSILRELSPKRKIDKTINVQMKLTIDPKQPSQNIRMMVPVPHNFGKKEVIAVFTSDDKCKSVAQELGISILGGEELINKVIQSDKVEFTKVLASREIYEEIKKKLGKILGPRKLMPSYTVGTVCDGPLELRRKIEELHKGSVELRNDKMGFLNFVLGKTSSSDSDLLENLNALMEAIRKSQQDKIKKGYVATARLGFNHFKSVLLSPARLLGSEELFLTNAPEPSFLKEKQRLLDLLVEEKKIVKTTPKNKYKNPDGTYSKSKTEKEKD